jgi:hypothetical protein
MEEKRFVLNLIDFSTNGLIDSVRVIEVNSKDHAISEVMKIAEKEFHEIKREDVRLAFYTSISFEMHQCLHCFCVELEKATSKEEKIKSDVNLDDVKELLAIIEILEQNEPESRSRYKYHLYNSKDLNITFLSKERKVGYAGIHIVRYILNDTLSTQFTADKEWIRIKRNAECLGSPNMSKSESIIDSFYSSEIEITNNVDFTPHDATIWTLEKVKEYLLSLLPK